MQRRAVVLDRPAQAADAEREAGRRARTRSSSGRARRRSRRGSGALAVGQQLAGGVVDRGDVVGVERVPQPERVRREPEADAEHGPAAQPEVLWDHEGEEDGEADHVQRADHCRERRGTTLIRGVIDVFRRRHRAVLVARAWSSGHHTSPSLFRISLRHGAGLYRRAPSHIGSSAQHRGGDDRRGPERQRGDADRVQRVAPEQRERGAEQRGERVVEAEQPPALRRARRVRELRGGGHERQVPAHAEAEQQHRGHEHALHPQQPDRGDGHDQQAGDSAGIRPMRSISVPTTSTSAYMPNTCAPMTGNTSPCS